MDKTHSGFMQRMLDGRVLFDGGMGSMLIANGLQPGAPPEDWNRSKPDIVRGIHAAYVAAGSNVITTNSFGATPSRLSGYGIGDAIAELNNRAVRLVREAIADREESDESRKGSRFVAFSVGPTGKMLPPVGQAVESEIEAEFAAQIESLDEPVDVVIGETFFDVREALLALGALKGAVEAPVGISLTFNKTPRGFFTVMGDPVADSLFRLETGGADFVAANCSISSKEMLELAVELRSATSLPLLCQPNAGSPTIENGMPAYTQRPEDFAADAAAMVEIGINAVGGCCGTTPEFINCASDLLRDS